MSDDTYFEAGELAGACDRLQADGYLVLGPGVRLDLAAALREALDLPHGDHDSPDGLCPLCGALTRAQALIGAVPGV